MGLEGLVRVAEGDLPRERKRRSEGGGLGRGGRNVREALRAGRGAEAVNAQRRPTRGGGRGNGFGANPPPPQARRRRRSRAENGAASALAGEGGREAGRAGPALELHANPKP